MLGVELFVLVFEGDSVCLDLLQLNRGMFRGVFSEFGAAVLHLGFIRSRSYWLMRSS